MERSLQVPGQRGAWVKDSSGGGVVGGAELAIETRKPRPGTPYPGPGFAVLAAHPGQETCPRAP